jgi:DnaJ-class molecular chaperone
MKTETNDEPRSGSLHVLVGAAPAESETCPECDGASVIAWSDDDGNETEATCPTCYGTGSVERIAPTAGGQGHLPAVVDAATKGEASGG